MNDSNNLSSQKQAEQEQSKNNFLLKPITKNLKYIKH